MKTKNELLADRLAAECPHPDELTIYLWENIRNRIFCCASLNSRQRHWFAAHACTRLHDAIEENRSDLASNFDARRAFVTDALKEIDLMLSTGPDNLKLKQWLDGIEEAHRNAFWASTSGLHGHLN